MPLPPRVPLPAAFLRAPLAHRALHDRTARRPENSRAAVRAAVAAGYGIEIDVQLSADGRAMVFHDYALDRLTDRFGPVRQRRAAELGAIALRDGDEGIPTFREVLETVAGRVALLVEVKDQDGMLGPDVGPLEQAVADDLRGYAGLVAVMSFNPHSVAALARLAPAIPRGITTWGYPPDHAEGLPRATCDRLRAIPDYDRCGASFISHHWQDLGRPRVAELRAQGAAVLCWTIRAPAEEAAARRVAANITFEGYAPPIPPPIPSL
ncbi:glycerophosphodiester phosphodiesterase family protein [Ruixingdingia sedimenti]|uniref:Glycerophosphodiester phosphodiesterase family protein n=1 Tax=Ruixingdingia sedimenti TaxID=3073604 RepID=A0ABU1F847_9RHOB|nr:glycerophosphodiester phosphodiesterase family protein [Xinfangfangia sp. LG-4]MDR5653041.1 glycerophosphodiester phosphodiesterase family protein [Xinfangfangia sp. LG-4]